MLLIFFSLLPFSLAPAIFFVKNFSLFALSSMMHSCIAKSTLVNSCLMATVSRSFIRTSIVFFCFTYIKVRRFSELTIDFQFSDLGLHFFIPFGDVLLLYEEQDNFWECVCQIMIPSFNTNQKIWSIGRVQKLIFQANLCNLNTLIFFLWFNFNFLFAFICLQNTFLAFSL